MTSRSDRRMRHIRWTRQRAIDALKALGDRIEREEGRRRTPRCRDIYVSEARCPWQRHVIKLFGSLADYQIASGFKPSKGGKPRRRHCMKGKHRMTRENTVIEQRRWKDGTGVTEVRRCLACKRDRRWGNPTTKRAREARRLANLERRKLEKQRAKERTREVRQRWGSPLHGVIVLREVEAGV